MNYHYKFFKNRDLGKRFGIIYKDSSTWTTDRDHTRLLSSQNLLSQFIFGQAIKIGDPEYIKNLKKRQKVPGARDINLVEYFNKGEKYNFVELEKKLIETWVEEITQVYQIPYPPDLKAFMEGISTMRNRLFSGTRMKILWETIKNIKKLSPLGKYWKILEPSEKLIVFVPFLTTIDTCMINLVSKSKPQQLNELFRNTPVKYVPMVSDDELVICDITPNDVNNPGNSVFGPKGVICPGNIVTSAMVKAMMNLMNHYDYKIEGSPKFGEGSIINRISNPEELFITF